jgi:hypothetical protein
MPTPRRARRLEYGSDIPGARIVLEQLHKDLMRRHLLDEAQQERIALAKMVRATPVRRTPVRNIRVTRKQRAMVLSLARTTDLSQQEIAEQVGLNHGRVSEILNDLR